MPGIGVRNGKHRRGISARVAMGLCVLAALALAGPARATDFTVTNLNDSGPGSLRQALLDAGADGHDRVLFDPSLAGTIALTSAELDVPADVEVLGPGAGRITVSGSGQFRVFHVSGLPTEPVTISGLTIADGLSGGGGAGVASGGPVTLSAVVLRNNTTMGSGGGVANSGALTVRDSTVTGNTGFAGGGISATGTALTIERSTIAGNTATSGTGGGVWHNISGQADPATIVDSTIAGNTAATNGGGIVFDTVARVSNSIVADNVAPNRPDIDITNMAPDVRATYSLIEQLAGVPVALDGPNLTGIDPQLQPLGANGGPTPTMTLGAGSPALDKGLSSASVDQRGAKRPYNLKGKPSASGGNAADIGAYERVLCGKAVVNLIGTTGKDKLRGTAGRDGILGLGGKDRLKGLKGKDGLCGGPGKDTLRGGPGRDTLLGQGGRDLLIGGKGKDKLKGGGGRDRERP